MNIKQEPDDFILSTSSEESEQRPFIKPEPVELPVTVTATVTVSPASAREPPPFPKDVIMKEIVPRLDKHWNRNTIANLFLSMGSENCQQKFDTTFKDLEVGQRVNLKLARRDKPLEESVVLFHQMKIVRITKNYIFVRNDKATSRQGRKRVEKCHRIPLKKQERKQLRHFTRLRLRSPLCKWIKKDSTEEEIAHSIYTLVFCA
jgi:hypothetical protein